MNSEIVTVLALIGVAVVLMVTELLPVEVVAWLLAIALVLSGAITPVDAFSGLSHAAVVTILGALILTNGLERTGVAQRLGSLLGRLAGDRPVRLLVLVMVSGAVLSLFMNNIAAAALLMPAVIDAARRTRTSPSRLLMPLAFGVILGGAATLLTTSNILVSAVLRDQGLAPFNLLDFVPVDCQW